jgi:hypothetical protein
MKDWLSDQRVGEWMGADKNSSSNSRTQLCPKITSKGSHTNLPRSHSQNGPTNRRNKSQTNPKRKHNSRSKGLRQFAVAWVDCPQGRRTIRRARADHPKLATEPLVAHRKIRAVRSLPADCPSRTDCPQLSRGPSAKLLATENHWIEHKELATNKKNNRL